MTDENVPDAPLLQVRDLRCEILAPAGTAYVLRGVDLTVPHGRTLGIVGESGSGKSMLLKSALGLLPAKAQVTGEVRFDGVDVLAMSAPERAKFLGRRVGVVFQNPMTSLNPVVPIGVQMAEASRFHLGLGKKEAHALAADLLDQVGVPNAAKRLRDYPHQFSGGMRQRVMIAMALTCEPDLLVADEATTALDVTIQKQILDLLQELQAQRRMAMILVSHDLSVVAGRTDEVIVMYAGRVVERKPTGELFSGETHPYVEALSRAIPRLDMPPHARLSTMTGAPPSVFDPRPDAAAAEREDLERWLSAAGGAR
jgi:ABC-type dipeptide/oligopeptide/nickel transport system, ATPase component